VATEEDPPLCGEEGASLWKERGAKGHFQGKRAATNQGGKRPSQKEGLAHERLPASSSRTEQTRAERERSERSIFRLTPESSLRAMGERKRTPSRCDRLLISLVRYSEGCDVADTKLYLLRGESSEQGGEDESKIAVVKLGGPVQASEKKTRPSWRKVPHEVHEK